MARDAVKDIVRRMRDAFECLEEERQRGHVKMDGQGDETRMVFTCPGASLAQASLNACVEELLSIVPNPTPCGPESMN